MPVHQVDGREEVDGKAFHHQGAAQQIEEDKDRIEEIVPSPEGAEEEDVDDDGKKQQPRIDAVDEFLAAGLQVEAAFFPEGNRDGMGIGFHTEVILVVAGWQGKDLFGVDDELFVEGYVEA